MITHISSRVSFVGSEGGAVLERCALVEPGVIVIVVEGEGKKGKLTYCFCVCYVNLVSDRCTGPSKGGCFGGEKGFSVPSVCPCWCENFGGRKGWRRKVRVLGGKGDWEGKKGVWMEDGILVAQGKVSKERNRWMS